MILSKTAILVFNNFNKKLIESKGIKYTKQGDKIEVDIKLLDDNSSSIVKCKCDFCGDIFETKFGSVSKEKYHSCGKKQCRNEKRKKTCLEKYGVSHVKKDKNIVQKAINTYHKHYDTEEKKKEIQEKAKKTRKERTGYEYALQNPETKEKFKKTCLKKYGVENPNQSKEIKEKINDSIIKHFGEKGKGHKSITEKRNKTNLEKYGAINYTASREYLLKKLKADKINNFKIKLELNKKYVFKYNFHTISSLITKNNFNINFNLI